MILLVSNICSTTLYLRLLMLLHIPYLFFSYFFFRTFPLFTLLIHLTPNISCTIRFWTFPAYFFRCLYFPYPTSIPVEYCTPKYLSTMCFNTIIMLEIIERKSSLTLFSKHLIYLKRSEKFNETDQVLKNKFTIYTLRTFRPILFIFKWKGFS